MTSKLRDIIVSILFVSMVNGTIAQTDANIHYKGICIYIDYPDVPRDLDKDRIDSLINGVNYEESTVKRTFRNYWYEQTRRNVIYEHDIFYFRAPQNTSYYKNLSDFDGTAMWRDALEYVIRNNPSYDWNTLSTGEQGEISSVMVLSSSNEPAGVGTNHGKNWTLSNGKSIRRIYGSALYKDSYPNINMFTPVHESAHGIYKWPDTYDQMGTPSHGTGNYTLMSGGKTEIEPIGAPFLVLHNWCHLVEPGPGTHTITLRADGDSVFVFRNPHDPFEFFTIEARKKINHGNGLFPVDLGLLLWHTDNKMTFNNNKFEQGTPMEHYTHSIEQPDGLFDLEQYDISNRGDAGDIYVPGTSFTTSTLPNSNWWTGEVSGFELNNIKFIDEDHIQFDIVIPEIAEDFHPVLDRTNWSVFSETTPSWHERAADKALDGDLDTYYHINNKVNAVTRPHEVVFDLGKPYMMNAFYYTANKNITNPYEGRVDEYEVYISDDVNNWGAPVAAGSFFFTRQQQYALFPETMGRYLKFSMISSHMDMNRTSVAEINVRGYDPTVTSVNEQLEAEDFDIFPNPAMDVLKVISTEKLTNASIEILDLNQQVVMSQNVNDLQQMNVQHLPSGIYFIKLLAPEKSRMKKFIKL